MKYPSLKEVSLVTLLVAHLGCAGDPAAVGGGVLLLRAGDDEAGHEAGLAGLVRGHPQPRVPGQQLNLATSRQSAAHMDLVLSPLHCGEPS